MPITRPAEAFPPGEFLREELEERGWTQADLADIMGRPAVLVNEVISGRRSITPETARGLAAALGTSAELWMRLDADWQLRKVSSDEPDLVAHRARVYARAPIREMVRRGWIEPTSNAAGLERQLLTFLGTSSLEDRFRLPYAAKRNSYAEPLTPLQEVWLARAAQIAPLVSTASSYSAVNFAATIEKLKRLVQSDREVRHVPRVLAEAGVRFLVLQSLPGSKMDGVAFWLSDDQPVIAMSLRLDRLDNFWFVLIHEAKHVLDRDALAIDDDIMARQNESDLPPNELAANAFAVETLIPREQLEGFISRVGPLYSARQVAGFAASNQVHPALVIGQLQHLGEIPWSNFRRTMVPVRDLITPSSLYEGWGMTLPTSA